MTEVLFEGEKYKGIFNGNKREIKWMQTVYRELPRSRPESSHHKWYDGAGFIQNKLTNKKYFFRFLIEEDFLGSNFFKPSLKKSLESLCTHFDDGFDSLCRDIISRIKESKEQIPEIRF